MIELLKEKATTAVLGNGNGNGTNGNDRPSFKKIMASRRELYFLALLLFSFSNFCVLSYMMQSHHLSTSLLSCPFFDSAPTTASVSVSSDKTAEADAETETEAEAEADELENKSMDNNKGLRKPASQRQQKKKAQAPGERRRNRRQKKMMAAATETVSRREKEEDNAAPAPLPEIDDKGAIKQEMMKQMKAAAIKKMEQDAKAMERGWPGGDNDNDNDNNLHTTLPECPPMNARERRKYRKRKQEQGEQPCRVINRDALPPCRVLVVNTAHWHTETLESIAKLIPVSSLDLDASKNQCNPKSLVFDYKVRKEPIDKKQPNRLMRTVEWMDYFDRHLQNTKYTKGGVTRHIRKATMMDFGTKTKDTLWKSKRAEYTSKDDFGMPYHSVVEATCYCNKETKSGKDWLADWMLNGESDHSRICIFHEKCPKEYHTPQSLWLSPHHENYYIPSSLPLAGPNPLPQTNKPVICSVGRTDRRNYEYVHYFLNYTSDHKEQQLFSNVKFRILGRGDFPLPPQYNTTVEHFPDIANDLEFADQIKNGCDALMLLMDPKSHPDYFMQEDSWLKLSGSIPPIIAYQKPFVIHKDLMELYSKDLLPLNLPHSTFDDKIWSFVPAVKKLFQEMNHFGQCSTKNSLPQPSFRSLAQDIDGLGKCLSRRDGQVKKMRKYIKSLDLYVVTPGGTGSEALIGYMHEHTNYTVRSPGETPHAHAVHLGSPLYTPLVWNPTQPTLVLMGEFKRSMFSMHSRANDVSRPYLLARNIAKNLYGAQECRQIYKHYRYRYPNDPVGFKSMMWTYISASRTAAGSRTVFLQPPYTKESIDQALRMIQMDDLANQLKGFQVRPRRNSTMTLDDGEKSALVKDMYKPYEKLEEMFETELPKVWLASQTPCNLYDLLLQDLQD